MDGKAEEAFYDLFQNAIGEDFGNDDSTLLEAFREVNNNDDCGLSAWQNCNEDGTVREMIVWLGGLEYKVTVTKVND